MQFRIKLLKKCHTNNVRAIEQYFSYVERCVDSTFSVKNVDLSSSVEIRSINVGQTL